MKVTVLSLLLAGLVVLAGCAPVPPGMAPVATATLSLAPAASTTSPSPAPQATTAAPAATALPAATTEAVPTTPAGPAATATGAPAPTVAPATSAPEPTVAPGFTTYRDPEAGLAIDYPEGWSLLVPPAEARADAQAYSVSIRSVSPDSSQPGGQPLPPGATGIDVTIYKTAATTFDEVVAERRAAIRNSETAVQITSEESWTLAGGLPAVRWQLDTAQAGTIGQVVTLINGKGIIVAGMGDLAQFDAIARSLRPLGTVGAAGATPAVMVSPDGGQTYADATLGFSLVLPPAWEVCQNTGWSRLFCLKQPEPTGPAFPRLWVTVLPPGFTNADASAYNFVSEEHVKAFMALPVGQTQVADGLPEYSTFTRLPDTTVSGLPGVVIENARVWEGGANTKDRRVLVKAGASTYMFGTYYETAEQLQEFEQVLSSVQLSAR